MTIKTPASGSRVKWYYCQEDANGDISAAAPAFTPIRFNSTDLSRETAQIDSDEINPNRQREKSRQGTYSLAGNIVANISYGSHDALLAAAFQSSWVTQPTITAATLSAAASDNSINDSGNGLIAAGFKVGDLVTISGFSGDISNNVADARIETLTAGKAILDSGFTLVDDAEGETVTMQVLGDYLEVGETVPTFALLRRNTDTGVDVLYRHNRVGGVSLAVTLNASATWSFPVLGESAEIYSVPSGSTFAAQTTTEMMVPTVGYMHDNHTAYAFLADYSLEFTNNMEALFSLFQRQAYAVSNGRFTVASGQMGGYQEDAALLTKYINETDTDHIVRLQDLAGNAYRIILPDVGYTQLSDPVQGEGAHIHTYTITAGYDGVTTARIERISA